MKKVLALALALIMALSMSAMAFAADEAYICPECEADLANATELNTHMKSVHTETEPNVCPTCGKEFYIESEYNKHIQLHDKTCPKCNRAFADEAEYNAHIEKCTVGDEKDYVDLTVKEILTMIIDIAKASMSQWDSIESVIVRLVDFLENIGTAAVSEADVKGAVADLESALAGIEVPAIDELLNALKQKIKDLYAGEVATTVEVTTEVAPPAETGSSSVGIAVFAAVSVAAAAAYVCTKKSK
ncbi:MAG: hypothetical protein IJZ07_08005 [Clostridia bacterium]|nr:hypothetical protein [Clostridia bacterium]